MMLTFDPQGVGFAEMFAGPGIILVAGGLSHEGLPRCQWEGTEEDSEDAY